MANVILVLWLIMFAIGLNFIWFYNCSVRWMVWVIFRREELLIYENQAVIVGALAGCFDNLYGKSCFFCG